MSNRRGSSVVSSVGDADTVAKQVYDECLDEIILSCAFDIHRSVKTGLFAVLEADSPTKAKSMDTTSSSASDPAGVLPNLAVDVFGQVISTMLGVPALKKQPECICPNCQRNLAASRFAPHLEKCMGMGRNSSRLASRRLATSGKETSYRESGMDEDEDDEDWIEPTKVVSTSRRKHRDKNSPRRTKAPSSGVRVGYSNSSSSKGDLYLVTGPDGSITPPSSYDILSIDERSNLLASICGVISTTSKKICTRTPRCPMHTDAQRREVRIRWLSNDEETHVDIDR
jgi:SAGA-associated factor 11